MCLHRIGRAGGGLSCVLIAALLAGSIPSPAAAQQLPEARSPFRVVVLEGEGSINNVKQPVNRGALVLVEDENKNALSGVPVTFFLPSTGASGAFPDGSRVLTVFTDERGLAATRAIRFNTFVGLMPIRVTASLFSETAGAIITQTNVSSASAVRSSMVGATGLKVKKAGPGKTRLIVVLAAVGAAAGAGYYFATKKTPPTATVGLGAPSVGGPR